MFLLSDRKRFSREILSLAGTSASAKKTLAVADDKFARMEAANAALENSLRPLLEAYAEIVGKAGRTCDLKTLAGSADSFPLRAAVAEFWLDVTDVPGVAQYFIRLESDGGDWLVSSRPGLGGKGTRHQSGQISIPNSKSFASEAEGLLQKFIRLTF